MQVKVVAPAGVVLEREAAKLVAEAGNGSFCLLPRHIDFVAALVPGILTLTADDGSETFLAVDEGVLVKHGPQVMVSSFNALQGRLGELQQAVLARFRQRDEQERDARLALDRLEVNLVHQILEWEGPRHG